MPLLQFSFPNVMLTLTQFSATLAYSNAFASVSYSAPSCTLSAAVVF